MTSRLSDDVAELIRMPTVSSCDPALRRAAAWLARRLGELGATRIPVPPTGAAPIVAAQRLHSPLAPTVLVYGHYDVVAPGPVDAWSVPPFAAVRGPKTVWGRGASDDKGPLVAVLHGLERQAAVNLKFLYEGEEEIGSPSLAGALRFLRGWLDDVDAILVCDTDATAAGRPTLTCALRGDLTVDLTATGSGRALHAGRYGGPVPNPAQALAAVITSLHHHDGRVAVRDFYDAVEPVPRLTDHEARLAPFAAPGWGEPGRTATERATTRPAAVVNSLCAGECGPGPWHTIPATARAKLNFRLVPHQRPADVERLVRVHVATHTAPRIRFEITPLMHIEPWRLHDLDNPAVRAARAAVQQVWRTPAALVRSGGSINAVPLLAGAAPRAVPLLLGFTLPSDNAHAADEHVDLTRLGRVSRTVVNLIDRISRSSR